jgi:eukaryotic-like serine/threonine-protein kinase
MADAPKSLEEIVDDARDMPVAERLRFLRDACANDEALLARALETLQVRSEDSDVDAAALQGPAHDLTGEVVGAYRILRSLGQGGMGEVYLAERADAQFRQNVAIKLVRRGLLSQQAQGRLRQERQILASLDHPNIARLYDGGTHTDGSPYIVMEYIDGAPIDVHCDALRLTLDARLRLFIAVCSAVHRAHQSLIVHRDLKPSNILVTKEGAPKLLDFGIAKLLDESDPGHTLALTQLDVRVMTPDHASPEQIRGDAITTASDIYVLGVLLYELLCGLKPFPHRRGNLAAIERALQHDGPPPPSVAVGRAIRDAPGQMAGVAEQRSTTPARLQRALRGDLDNIIDVAMRNEPERRYPSVEQLAADVQNYLEGLPVRARPDAWTYRARKFVRRHAALTALSAGSLALLIAFAISTYVQAQRIAYERDQAQVQRARAEAERERAEEVSTFLIESFREADPARARGDAMTAREILDSGARRATNELRAQPALQAALLDTIGSVYLSLGRPQQAQPLLERSLTVRRASNASQLDVARSLYFLSQVHEQQGDLTRAEALARESLEMNESLAGENSLVAAEGLCRLGFILRQKDELRAAEQRFKRCLEIRSKTLGPTHEKVAIPLDNLAYIAQNRGDHAAAEKFLQDALEIDRRTRGEDHPQYLHHMFRLATLLERKGDVPAALVLYERVAADHRRVLGVDHPETIDALSAYGGLLLQADRIDEAEKVLKDVLAMNVRVRGPKHAYVGNDLENLGRVALKTGRNKEAAARFREALDIYEQTLPAGHGLIAAAWTMLGRAALADERPAAAENALARAMAEWRIEYGEGSLGYALAEALRGRALMLEERHAEAAQAFARAYPIIAKSDRPPDQEIAASVREWLTKTYERLGRAEAAAAYFNAAANARADSVRP